MRDFDLLFLTEDRLLEIDGEIVAQIIALLRTTSSLTPPGLCTSETAEERLEQIGETAHVTHVGRSGGTAESCFSELVVPGPALRIAEHFIGPADLLEAILRTRFLVDVGVVLTGHAAIGPLQGVGCLLYTSPSPRDTNPSRMPSSA